VNHPLRPVLVIVMALYFLSLDHGLPQRYVPDDHAVRCALGIARDLGDGAVGTLQALVPPAGHYTTYPYLLPYADLAAIGATYAGGRLVGAWHGTGEFGERVLANPTLAWLPARVVTALLTLLLPLATYRAARELGRGRNAAALAALLAGSSLLVVHFAHTERPWAPMTALIAVTLAASLRLRRRRRVRDWAWAGACAGLAAATHPAGALAFGLPALAALAWRPGVRALLAAAAAGLLVALLVGYPHLLVYRADTGRGAIAGQLGADNAVELGGQAFDPTRLAGALAGPIAAAWFGYDPVLVVLGLIGVVLAARGLRGRGAPLLLVPPLVLALLFLLYDGSHVRYLMPAAPFLAIGAVETLRRLLQAQGGPRGVRVALAAAVVALPLLQAARLDLLLGRLDTRTEAAQRIADLTQPGQLIAVDGYGPPLQPSAASIRRWHAQVWASQSEERALALAEAGVPEPSDARDVLPLYRFWKFQSCYPSDYLGPGGPTELEDFMQAWQVRWYAQVDRAPWREPRAPVDAFTAAHGTLAFELSPTGATAPCEAALPTEMSFALRDLWRYERPGAWVRLWRLDGGGP
jgi:Dolichyl-phosphate-mannose-protein mannosyltransferase